MYIPNHDNKTDYKLHYKSKIKLYHEWVACKDRLCTSVAVPASSDDNFGLGLLNPTRGNRSGISLSNNDRWHTFLVVIQRCQLARRKEYGILLNSNTSCSPIYPHPPAATTLSYSPPHRSPLTQILSCGRRKHCSVSVFSQETID